MDSGLRAEVARRVWIGLCVLECCTFVCIPIINALAATIYLKLWNLNIVSWAVKHEVPEVFWVFAAVELVWSTFLYGILRRGSTIQMEMRLRLFFFTAFLGGTVWALIIVVALCRGSCASNAVDRVQKVMVVLSMITFYTSFLGLKIWCAGISHSKRWRLSSPSGSDPGAKCRSSPKTALSIGQAPLPAHDDNQYTVECLLKRRKRRRVIEYLVKWQGYGEEDNSWVRAADIHPGLIKNFTTAATAAVPGAQRSRRHF